MAALGWGPYQNDHEDANGQFEMNWAYADRPGHRRPPRLLQVHGQDASPRSTACARPSCPSRSPPDRLRLPRACLALARRRSNAVRTTRTASSASRQLAYHFLGGLMAHAEALCALTNPTVNSYKRINAPRDRCRAPPGRPTPSPTAATTAPTWSASPTPAASSCASPTAPPTPICCRPACWRPGWTASRANAIPGKRLDINMYIAGPCRSTDARRLPLNLLDAVRAFEACDAVARGARRAFVDCLRQAQAAGLERLLPPPDAVGARHDAGLLTCLLDH